MQWLKIKNGNPMPALVLAKKEWRGNHGVAVALPEVFVSNLVATLTTTSDPIDLLNDLKWISGFGDVVAGKQTIIAEYGSSEAAKKVMDRLRNLPSSKQEKTVEIEQVNSRLTARYSIGSRFLHEVFGAVVENSSVADSRNQMKQIALALHQFYDVHNCIPPQAIADKEGKRLLSWRVLLLPYLDQKELYAKFHLDEPWDSPHNLGLVKQMPKVYSAADLSNAMDGRTRYLAPLTRNSTMGTPGAPLTFNKITDGTSNTIWMVEVSEKQALVWTKPEDILVDPKDPLRGIASPGSDRFQASRLDGSVGEISSKIKPETANALFSINGGEVIEEKDLKPE